MIPIHENEISVLSKTETFVLSDIIVNFEQYITNLISSFCSKKDKELRQREILDAASKPLLKMVVDNVRELVFDKSRSQLALAILTFATGRYICL